jgi:hypothetical protein
MPQPDKTYSFKDPTRLTQWVKIALVMQIVLAVIAIVSDVMEYQSLLEIQLVLADPQAQMNAASDANDTRQGIIAVLQVLMIVVGAIVFVCWVYLANANAHALGARAMRNTPGWSVGWFFVPIANLWKPYSVMKEIWKASENPRNPDGVTRPALLPWWWFLWLFGSFVGQGLFRLSLADNDPSTLMAANIFTVFSDALDIPLNLVLIVIINRICRMQMDHFAASNIVGTESAPAVPSA